MSEPSHGEVAVIWIPADVDPLESHAVACLNHTRRCGYRLEGIITTAPWDAVRQMMIDRKVDVVVVADLSHLPPDRTPRVEIASDRPVDPAPHPGHVPPRRRRPRAR